MPVLRQPEPLTSLPRHRFQCCNVSINGCATCGRLWQRLLRMQRSDSGRKSSNFPCPSCHGSDFRARVCAEVEPSGPPERQISGFLVDPPLLMAMCWILVQRLNLNRSSLHEGLPGMSNVFQRSCGSSSRLSMTTSAPGPGKVGESRLSQGCNPAAVAGVLR